MTSLISMESLLGRYITKLGIFRTMYLYPKMVIEVKKTPINMTVQLSLLQDMYRI